MSIIGKYTVNKEYLSHWNSLFRQKSWREKRSTHFSSCHVLFLDYSYFLFFWLVSLFITMHHTQHNPEAAKNQELNSFLLHITEQSSMHFMYFLLFFVCCCFFIIFCLVSWDFFTYFCGKTENRFWFLRFQCVCISQSFRLLFCFLCLLSCNFSKRQQSKKRKKTKRMK